MRPAKNTYPSYYEHYLSLVKQNDLLDALQINCQEIKNTLLSIPPGKERYAYADGKWSVLQLISHINDTERILSYRALRFSRKDPQQPLPFSEDDYAANSGAERRSVRDLCEEFEAIRKATIFLFRNCSEETLLLSGETSIGRATVLSIGYMICGHANHHIAVLRERYLNG